MLVDEATQATEASALVAFCRGARQVALLGDQYQLPPTTVARHADALAASQPLFTRLVTEGLPALMLDTQYRMHPGIAMLPADLFYGGRLASGVACEERHTPTCDSNHGAGRLVPSLLLTLPGPHYCDRPAVPGFAWPRPDWPVALVPVHGGSESSDGSSKMNRTEAEATARVVQQLLAGGTAPADIGVISPYAAQARRRPIATPSAILLIHASASHQTHAVPNPFSHRCVCCARCCATPRRRHSSRRLPTARGARRRRRLGPHLSRCRRSTAFRAARRRRDLPRSAAICPDLIISSACTVLPLARPTSPDLARSHHLARPTSPDLARPPPTSPDLPRPRPTSADLGRPQVIVFSCVRASPHGGLGFLADARRVNVAFTRAKRGLIVLGHPATLTREEGTWLPWLRWGDPPPASHPRDSFDPRSRPPLLTPSGPASGQHARTGWWRTRRTMPAGRTTPPRRARRRRR